MDFVLGQPEQVGAPGVHMAGAGQHAHFGGQEFPEQVRDGYRVVSPGLVVELLSSRGDRACAREHLIESVLPWAG